MTRRAGTWPSGRSVAGGQALYSSWEGRAVVLASGAPATLVRTLPWMAGPHGQAVTASIRAHDPAPEATLDEARQSVAASRSVEPFPAGAGR